MAGLAASRFGVVTRRELLAVGVDDSTIRRALVNGDLERLFPGVYHVGHGDVPRLGQMRASLAAVGADAAISHTTAPELHGRPAGTGPCHVTTTNRSGHVVAGISIHRVRCAPEVTTRHGLRTTTTEQTALGLAVVTDEATVQRFVNQCLYDRTIHVERLACLARGRRGARMITRILANAAPTRSPLEDRFYALIKAAALPPPLANRYVGPYQVDFLWPGHRFIVETDGWAGHGHSFAQRADPRKDAYLNGLDFRTQRLPGHRLERHSYQVIGELAVALSSSGT